MNKILLAWTIIFIIIGGGILLYGTGFNPIAWATGQSSFKEPEYDPIPWDLLVIGYVFFGVIGTGVSTYNSLYEVLNKNHQDKNPFKSISLRNEWLALAILIPGWIMVFASVDKSAGAIQIYANFANTDNSRMAWNGILYVLVGIGIIAEIILLIYEERRKVSKATQFASLAILAAGYAILVELMLDANLGALFGYLSVLTSNDFGFFMPILFVVLSFYGGIAAISFTTIIYNKFKKSVITPGEVTKNVKADPPNDTYKTLARDGILATIAVGFLVFWWMWILSTINPGTFQWADLILSGNYSSVFWGGIVVLAIILPLALYGITYKKPNSILLMLAGILAILGMFMTVTLMLVVPQIIIWNTDLGPTSITPFTPPGSFWVYEYHTQYLGQPLWYSFFPSVFSIGLYYDVVWFVGSALLLLGLYPLGALILPLEEKEEAKHWIFK